MQAKSITYIIFIIHIYNTSFWFSANILKVIWGIFGMSTHSQLRLNFRGFITLLRRHIETTIFEVKRGLHLILRLILVDITKGFHKGSMCDFCLTMAFKFHRNSQSQHKRESQLVCNKQEHETPATHID